MENKNVLISVIVRTFNRAVMLKRAVESVLRQTYTNFELIIVDDVSTDGTLEFIERLKSADGRIRLIRRDRNSRENPRVEPMNDGIEAARGELICHLDDDNGWRENFLQVLSGAILSNANVQLAYGDTCENGSVELIDEMSRNCLASKRICETQLVIPHRDEFTQIEFNPDGRFYLDYIDTNEMMYRRPALEAIGGRWSMGHPLRDKINQIQGEQYAYRLHNDVEIAERIYSEFGPGSLLYVPEVLIDYYEPPSRSNTDIYNSNQSVTVEMKIAC